VDLAVESLSPSLSANRLCSSIAEHLSVSIDRIRLTSSGTEALYLALSSIRRDASDEVILPTFVCPNVIEAVLFSAMTPVLADIDADWNMGPEQVEPMLTNRTRAVITTHTFGAPARIAELTNLCESRGIALVDDAAQAFGAFVKGRPVGSWGTYGVLSFGKHKPVFGAGGGALVLPDVDHTTSVRRVRNVPQTDSAGWKPYGKAYLTYRLRSISSGLPIALGMQPALLDDTVRALESLELDLPQDSSPTGLQLATTYKQLDKLRENRATAHRYLTQLVDAVRDDGTLSLPPVSVLDGELNLLPFICPPALRMEISHIFASRGIETTWVYYPLHRISRFARFANSSLPMADSLWPHLITIPCRGWHTPSQMDHLASTIHVLHSMVKS
jgi:dTDP-4-amino-4,6-dideoxygalactose transaminase